MEKKQYNFLYIEDEVDKVKAQIQGIERTGDLKIILQKADSFEKLFEKKIFDNIDGLILDYRLDVNKDGSEKAFYKAPSLAQELRNKILENEINNDFPIILCSTDKQRVEPLQNDSTSNDLFDFKYLKDASFNASYLTPVLHNLAEGYKVAIEADRLDKIINRSIVEVNQQVFTKFLSKKYPPHEISRFIIHQMLEVPSIVIDEYLLAARLGIDIKQSTDWDKVKNVFFAEARYTGVFCSIWERWWMDKVLDIFKTLTGKSLTGLNARQRVELLKSHTDLNIIDAQPIKHSKSTRYWTICQAYKRPLDTIEGFRVLSPNDGIYSWQESLYVSLDACLERETEAKNINLSPLENERLELAKELL